MPTLNEVKSQITNLDWAQKLLARNEIKRLPNILWESENIENIIQWVYNGWNWVLVWTNLRLVFVVKWLFWVKIEDFSYDKISSVQYETWIMFWKITIFTSWNRAIIDYLIKDKTMLFWDWLRTKISSPKKDNTNNKVENNLIEQLEKLGKLKEQWILTDEEFNLQKSKLLS